MVEWVGMRVTVKPLLVVISAPSGTGKSTLCDLLLEEFPNLSYSISCTTRKPRGEEEDGVDYYFLSEAEFLRRRDNDEFLEWAQVHGHYYGTPAAPVEEIMREGRSVLMDIDVEGARQVRFAMASLPDANPLKAGFTDIFIRPPSLQELRRRLVDRGEDTKEEIERRLAAAEEELSHAGEFRYRLVNDDLRSAYRILREILLMRSGCLGDPD